MWLLEPETISWTVSSYWSKLLSTPSPLSTYLYPTAVPTTSLSHKHCVLEKPSEIIWVQAARFTKPFSDSPHLRCYGDAAIKASSRVLVSLRMAGSIFKRVSIPENGSKLQRLPFILPVRLCEFYEEEKVQSVEIPIRIFSRCCSHFRF